MTTKQLASQLADAYRSGAIAPIADHVDSVDAAYAVQNTNTERWIAAGRRLVGRKIGLTSPAVQRQLGVDQPDYGMLFADMACDEGADIDMSSLIQPKAEAEIAFVLGADLPHADATVVELISAIDYALPAIEVVDSRIADWQIGIRDTIADNASSGLYVVGSQPVSLDSVDTQLCGMVMERRGEPVSTGVGRACMGSPLSAAAWLARTMAAAGRPLLAGDTILSGALGPMVTIEPGDVIEARISGLGTVTACFSNDQPLGGAA